MPTIDIPIPADLNQLFQFPPCSQVTLKPATSLQINLPTGGTFTAFADLSKGIPSDCSLTFNLFLQLAPFMASIECLLKVLGLIGPLVEFVKAVPDPIKLASTVPQFLQAAEAVMPCVAVVTGFGIIPFIKDLLCLIIKALSCFVSQMTSLIATITSLENQLSAALAGGNNDLAAAIKCEQDNAAALAGSMTASIQPIGVILQLAGTLFSLVGIQAPSLPSSGGGTDLSSLNTLLQTIQDFINVLKDLAAPLGGCDS